MTERRMGQWPVDEPTNLAGLSGGEVSNDAEAKTEDALYVPVSYTHSPSPRDTR